MRGEQQRQAAFIMSGTIEERIPKNHPLRRVRTVVDPVLVSLSPLFDGMYAQRGRPSIPPEHLLKGLLLMVLYSIRSERQLCERLEYDLLFKWFLDLNLDDPVFDHSTFSKNWRRFIEHDVARKFFAAVEAEARARGLLSAEHFSVDGSLIEAWASLKSFQPKDQPPPEDGSGAGRNPSVDYRGKPRTNGTHHSTTDADARLATKGRHQAAKLSFIAHLLTENRHGLICGVRFTQANGRAEREAAVDLITEALPGTGRVTLGADRGYDTAAFVAALTALGVTPHVAQHKSVRHRSAVSEEVAATSGYATSQRRRKLVEECFGWMKVVGPMRKLRHRGLAKNAAIATLTASAYNLVRMGNLSAVPAA